MTPPPAIVRAACAPGADLMALPAPVPEARAGQAVVDDAGRVGAYAADLRRDLIALQDHVRTHCVAPVEGLR